MCVYHMGKSTPATPTPTERHTVSGLGGCQACVAPIQATTCLSSHRDQAAEVAWAGKQSGSCCDVTRKLCWDCGVQPVCVWVCVPRLLLLCTFIQPSSQPTTHLSSDVQRPVLVLAVCAVKLLQGRVQVFGQRQLIVRYALCACGGSSSVQQHQRPGQSRSVGVSRLSAYNLSCDPAACVQGWRQSRYSLFLLLLLSSAGTLLVTAACTNAK